MTPVILAGGSGIRLWPLSRDDRPKQFQSVTSGRSSFLETLARVSDVTRFTAPLITASRHHRSLIEQELTSAGISPAAGDLLLVLPSDHHIRSPAKLDAAIAEAAALARSGWLVTFGTPPHAPHINYGYIDPGEALAGGTACRIASFVEKPPLDIAREMLMSGRHFWNSGMFVFPLPLVIAELEVAVPSLIAACRVALSDGTPGGAVIAPDPVAFAAIESISIVMR